MPEAIFELLNKHVKVSRETCERLTLYYDLLVKWQSKVNLVGPDTIADAWKRHFLDSLQLAYFIENRDGIIVDIGTGAGFPGLVLAIAGYDVHLIESDTKKVSFLKEVARITHTNVAIHHNRVENISIDNVSVIVSRACAPLEKLFSYSEKFVSHGTICLFHKGKNYSKDIEDANSHWQFDVAALPSVTDVEGVILKVENLRKRGV